MAEQPPSNEQHIFNHYDNDGARIYVKVERNSKGFNWEATVTGARTVAEALDLLEQANNALKARYGGENSPTTIPAKAE